MTDTPEHTQHVFKPTREHILAIVLATGIALMGILWAPRYLAWLLIFPAVWLAWVLASSTTVDERCLLYTSDAADERCALEGAWCV